MQTNMGVLLFPDEIGAKPIFRLAVVDRAERDGGQWLGIAERGGEPDAGYQLTQHGEPIRRRCAGDLFKHAVLSDSECSRHGELATGVWSEG
jgi:hypothetical protein